MREPRDFAAVDPGSASNAFAIAIVTRDSRRREPRFRLRLALEWIPRPGRPLDIDRIHFPLAAQLSSGELDVRWLELVAPWDVEPLLGALSAACPESVRADSSRTRTVTLPWKCEQWASDPYYWTSCELRGGEHGLTSVCVPPDAWRVYDPVRRALYRGQVALGGLPESAEVVRQLKRVVSRPADGGRVKVIVPAEGALHGDLGVAVVRALWLARAGRDELGEGGACDEESGYSRLSPQDPLIAPG